MLKVRDICQSAGISTSSVDLFAEMAFANRLGSIFRTNVSNPQVVPAMLNAYRGMASMKLFVGGLSYGTDDTSLKEAFSNYGTVVEARVITDRDTGRSRGFGFVGFTSEEAASSALNAMDGQALHGRNIRVSFAQERPPRADFGGFRGDSGPNDSY